MKSIKLSINRKFERFGDIRITAKAGERKIGYLHLKDGGVEGIHVIPSHQRRGIATKLYERAAKIACETFQTPLYSGSARSPEAQKFWMKQVKRGRAECKRRSSKLWYKQQGNCVYYQLKDCSVRGLK